MEGIAGGFGTATDLDRARAWLKPTLDTWCDAWDGTVRENFTAALVAVLCAAKREGAREALEACEPLLDTVTRRCIPVGLPMDERSTNRELLALVDSVKAMVRAVRALAADVAAGGAAHKEHGPSCPWEPVEPSDSGYTWHPDEEA